MRVGLVLEGGAMRGMYTAAVLDVFLKYGIRADIIVGVSAGALFGVNYLSNQAGRAIRYNKRFNSDKYYMGIRPLLREGNIVSTNYAYYNVPRFYDPFDDEAFKASGVPFYAVVANIESGEPEYVRINSVLEQMDVLRASGSLPFVSKPVRIGGEKYLDGGICDGIPFRWMESQEVDRMIVVLTRDASYVKKAMPSALVKAYSVKHPAVAKRLAERHNEYNTAVRLLGERERAGKAFVIRPSVPLRIKKLEKDPEKLQVIYDIGLSDAESLIPALKDYLK